MHHNNEKLPHNYELILRKKNIEKNDNYDLVSHNNARLSLNNNLICHYYEMLSHYEKKFNFNEKVSHFIKELSLYYMSSSL